MSKLVRLTIIKRYMTSGFLYHKNRAYRVDDDKAEQLCMVEHRDMPVFKVVTEAYLDKRAEAGEIISVVDMTSELEAEEFELEEDVAVESDEIINLTDIEKQDKEDVKDKSVVTKKVAKKKAAKKKVAIRKKPATPNNDDVEMVD